MYPQTLRTIVVGLVGLLGLVLATAEVHPHAYHRGGVGIGQHYAQLVKDDLQKPPTGPVYRCHDPHPEIFGPAPSVEDCDDVIAQFSTLTTDIDVKLVEGCYQIVSGNCTGLVCPQRPGESRIPGAEAAKYMATPIRDECIAKGQRGWWSDGTGWGVGVYLA